jgi:hypothetical protein
MITKLLLPPPLVHELRARSFSRLFRMTGNPGNRGFGRYLRQRIHLVVRRERTLVEKAITVAYLGSYLTDHIIYAEKVAARLLDGRDLTEGEEQERWVDNYQGVIAKIIQELPDGESILQELQVLDRYTRLPASVHVFRNRHWRPLHHMLTTTLTDLTGNISEIPLVNRVHAILARTSSFRSKARAVCLVASLLADMECWSDHMPWHEAYLKVMTELYPLLQKHPDVLEEVVHLG